MATFREQLAEAKVNARTAVEAHLGGKVTYKEASAALDIYEDLLDQWEDLLDNCKLSTLDKETDE